MLQLFSIALIFQLAFGSLPSISFAQEANVEEPIIETPAVKEQPEGTDKPVVEKKEPTVKEEVETPVEQPKKEKKLQTKSAITNNILSNHKFNDGNGVAVTKEKPMAPGDTLAFESDWSLPNGHSYKAGDTFTFTLPEQFLIGGAPKGTLSGNNIEYGSYTVSSSGEVVFTFNKAIEEESNISGKFKISSKLKEDLLGTPEQSLVVKVPGAGDLTTEILVKPTKGTSLEKSGKLDQTPNPTKATWTIDVNKKLDQLTNAKVSDEIPEGLKLIPGSIKVYELNVDLNGTATRGAEVNVSSPTFPLVLPNKNKAYQIVYDTEILEKKNASYTNNASVNINGEKISAASTVNT